MVWGAIGGAAIGAIGSIAGESMGASQAGSYNKARQRDQFAFQERMAKTAYQRAAKDLDKAGLNRILALGQPAATPAGATASIQAPKYGSAAIQAASAVQAIQQSKAQADLLKEQARLTGAEADKSEVTKMLYRKLGPQAEALADDLIGRFGSNAPKSKEPTPWKFIKDLATDPATRSAAKSSTRDAIDEAIEAIKSIPSKSTKKMTEPFRDWRKWAKEKSDEVKSKRKKNWKE